jgi:hypothetical protein
VLGDRGDGEVSFEWGCGYSALRSTVLPAVSFQYSANASHTG